MGITALQPLDSRWSETPVDSRLRGNDNGGGNDNRRPAEPPRYFGEEELGVAFRFDWELKYWLSTTGVYSMSNCS